MKVSEIKKVLILGAGTMGQQIGTVCAKHGYNVMVYDIKQEVLDRSLARMKKLIGWMAQVKQIGEADAAAAIARISATTSPEEAARNADIISESVPEDPALKGEIFAQFNRLCPAHTIFTTNTSTLMPSMFAEQTGRPAQFAALHFHDVRITTVVDIMPHPGTAPETIALITEFAVSIGQLPIVLQRENSGYVFNAMLSALMTSAMTLASGGVAAIEDIDRAWMGVMHTPAGPFGIMDSVGIDTVHKISDYWGKKTKDPQLQKNAAFLKEYVDKGSLGLKTGKGFYSYPNPAFTLPGFLKGFEGK